jgi:hypothetical protein
MAKNVIMAYLKVVSRNCVGEIANQTNIGCIIYRALYVTMTSEENRK